MLCYKCGSYNQSDATKCSVCDQKLSKRRSTGLLYKNGKLKGEGKQPSFEPGFILGKRFKILSPYILGAGGWVYKALDHKANVTVALKVLHPNLLQSKQETDHFEKHIKEIVKIKGDNILKIYSWGKDKGFHFYSTPFIEGLSLRKILNNKINNKTPFKKEEILQIIKEVVSYADLLKGYKKSHSFIRPENILINADQVYISGLGHGRALPTKPYLSLIKELQGEFYLAPEKRKRFEKGESATDIYCLGMIAFECLSGLRSKKDKIDFELFKGFLGTRMVGLLKKSTHENADNRYSSANKFLNDFESALNFPGCTPLIHEKATPLKSIEIISDNNKIKELIPEPLDEFGSSSFTQTHGLGAPTQQGNLEKLGDEVSFDIMLDEPSVPKLVEETIPGTPSAYFEREKRISEENFEVKKKGGGYWPWILSLFGMGLLALGVFKFCDDSFLIDSNITDNNDNLEQNVTNTPDEINILPLEPEVVTHPGLNQNIPEINNEKTNPELSPEKISKDPNLGTQNDDNFLDNKNPDEKESINENENSINEVKTPEKPKEKVKEKKLKCPRGMLTIPEGRFSMGSKSTDADRTRLDAPFKIIRLKKFCIDKYEYPNRKGSRPMTKVTWGKAQQICESKGKRLCKETEWERTCGGPKDTKYPTGGFMSDQLCNIGENNSGIVGSGSYSGCKNRFGSYDMSGNVSEWTSTTLGSGKVLKGGKAGQAEYMGRCANRVVKRVGHVSGYVGFRCCADLD